MQRSLINNTHPALFVGPLPVNLSLHVDLNDAYWDASHAHCTVLWKYNIMTLSLNFFWILSTTSFATVKNVSNWYCQITYFTKTLTNTHVTCDVNAHSVLFSSLVKLANKYKFWRIVLLLVAQLTSCSFPQTDTFQHPQFPPRLVGIFNWQTL